MIFHMGQLVVQRTEYVGFGSWRNRRDPPRVDTARFVPVDSILAEIERLGGVVDAKYERMIEVQNNKMMQDIIRDGEYDRWRPSSPSSGVNPHSRGRSTGQRASQFALAWAVNKAQEAYTDRQIRKLRERLDEEDRWKLGAAASAASSYTRDVGQFLFGDTDWDDASKCRNYYPSDTALPQLCAALLAGLSTLREGPEDGLTFEEACDRVGPAASAAAVLDEHLGDHFRGCPQMRSRPSLFWEIRARGLAKYVRSCVASVESTVEAWTQFSFTGAEELSGDECLASLRRLGHDVDSAVLDLGMHLSSCRNAAETTEGINQATREERRAATRSLVGQLSESVDRLELALFTANGGRLLD